MSRNHSSELVDWRVYPLTVKEAAAIRQYLTDTGCSSLGANRLLLRIVRAARRADAHRSLAVPKLPRSRVTEKLRRLAGSKRAKLPRDAEALIGLALGASRLGFMKGADPAVLRRMKLTPRQIRASASAALKATFVDLPGSPRVLSGVGGRPPSAVLDDYVGSLMQIYSKATGRKATFSRHGPDSPRANKPSGPLMRLLRLCLPTACFPLGIDDENLASSIRRITQRAKR